jgi:hypothetical protein
MREALETWSVVGNPFPTAVLVAYISTDSLQQVLSFLVGPNYRRSPLALPCSVFLCVSVTFSFFTILLNRGRRIVVLPESAISASALVIGIDTIDLEEYLVNY